MKECVFCQVKKNFSDRQILYSDGEMYLCVPKGQIFEGYLLLSFFEHKGTIGQLNGKLIGNIEKIIANVRAFYKNAYGINDPIIYEQGRAGGGALIDTLSGFPFHAHLCFLPIEHDFFPYFDSHFECTKDFSLSGLANIYCPYFYIERNGEKRLYTGRDADGAKQLEEYRFKEIIRDEMHLTENYYWRDSNDSELIENVIQKYANYRKLAD